MPGPEFRIRSSLLRRCRVMKSCPLLAYLLAQAAGISTGLCGWAFSRPGWSYEFPRDHGPHLEFQTEWWYFTGNLKSSCGRDFGFQLTFFRQGVVEPGRDLPTSSRFLVRDVAFAHFAVSDFRTKSFHHAQRLSRGAFGEVAFSDRRVRIEDWSTLRTGDHDFTLQAEDERYGINLTLRALKPPVVHGESGISRKAEGPGRASHYYSLTRLEATGEVRTRESVFKVAGLAWFDHEWFTNQLTADQSGWDWFSIQLEEGSELMLFQIRDRKGGRDPFSSGTLIAADGSSRKICDFELEPLRRWRSPKTGGLYPVAWRLNAADFELIIEARMDNQELTFEPVVYWEGAVTARGRRGSSEIRGSGYLEMTGYGGPLAGLQAPESP